MVLVGKNLPANAGDLREAGLISGLGRSTGGGHGNPLQYSCLENPMDRGAWHAMVLWVAQSWTQLKQLCMTAPIYLSMRHIFSVQFSCSIVSNISWPQGPQHTSLPCPSPTPGICSNSCPLSWWCHPTVSSSFVPFSSCLQSFLASGSFSNESVLCIRWLKYCIFYTFWQNYL